MYRYQNLQGFSWHYISVKEMILNSVKYCYCFLSNLLNVTNSVLLCEKTLTKGTDTITKVGLGSSLTDTFDMQCYLIVYLFIVIYA